MIPLGAGDIPTTGEELEARITSALGAMLQGGGRRPAVQCKMSSPNSIEQLKLDVTQVEVGAAKVARPQGFTRLGAAEVADFSIAGDPAMVFGAPVLVKTDGANLPMAWSRDDRGILWLVPTDAAPGAGNASGKVELAAEVAQIERAARAAVSAIAEQQGAKLKDLDLKITPSGPRGLAIRADVAASKFMMTARVAVTAEANLDDDMNLNVGRLNVTGDGAAGNMVANMLAPKLRQWEGQRINLGQFVFAGAKLKDVELKVDNQVHLSAKFGG